MQNVKKKEWILYVTKNLGNVVETMLDNSDEDADDVLLYDSDAGQKYLPETGYEGDAESSDSEHYVRKLPRAASTTVPAATTTSTITPTTAPTATSSTAASDVGAPTTATSCAALR